MENGIDGNFTLSIADNFKFLEFQTGFQTSFIECQNNWLNRCILKEFKAFQGPRSKESGLDMMNRTGFFRLQV